MERIAPLLLPWFEANKRLLPFRQEPSAYHIWVSEIMLQQTRVAAALPYYERFIRELPDAAALAACDADTLHKLWQGLGYYNRVNNMQKAARVVCERYGGALPADYDALRALPGIGDYTAGAIASIAFGIPAPAVDGNVLRVFARLYDDDADITKPETKRKFTDGAGRAGLCAQCRSPVPCLPAGAGVPGLCGGPGRAAARQAPQKGKGAPARHGGAGAKPGGTSFAAPPRQGSAGRAVAARRL